MSLLEATTLKCFRSLPSRCFDSQALKPRRQAKTLRRVCLFQPNLRLADEKRWRDYTQNRFVAYDFRANDDPETSSRIGFARSWIFSVTALDYIGLNR